MNLYHVISMVGGLALFLYGMQMLGEGLSKLSGGRMEAILAKMTNHPIKGVLLGAGTTAVIQSSSATTVMVVGFVNSGMLKLKQAVGIIMGANVGTTITSWILSLSGIKSSNVFLTVLKPEVFSPVLAMVGIILYLFCHSERKKDIGGILIGFAILMYGMTNMSAAVEPLKDVPGFTRLFLAFSNPVMGIIAGAVLTALIQSSSASVGILQALCATGAVPYSAVLPIIMGQNIGTCITALLSAVGASTNAKRAACIHLYFNMIGTVVFMAAFYIIHFFVPFEFLGQTAVPAGIAVIHSCFNVFATIILLPFSQRLVTLATLSVKEKQSEEEMVLPEKLEALSNMDKRFLENPPFALKQCEKTTEAMLSLAGEAAGSALAVVREFDKKKAVRVEKLENYVDQYEEKINEYMFQIGLYALSETDSRTLSRMQHGVGHIERIADYSLGIVNSMTKMQKKKLFFSKDAGTELCLYGDIVLSLVAYAADYWKNPDAVRAQDVFQLEEERNRIEKKILKNHKKRLKRGKCSVNTGFLLADILAGMKKIAEHSIHMVEDSGNLT